MQNEMQKWFRANKIEKKFKENEFTVVSGIFMQRDNEDKKLVAVGMGTKCIGRHKMKDTGCVLNDSHAEVIAKRSFQRYLMLQIYHLQNKKDDEPSILERVGYVYRLKNEYQVYLYSTEMPCGDAAIISLGQGLHMEETNRKRVKLTGAKSVMDGKWNEQQVGVVRIKSCRSDTPVRCQTLSMCCSDKIAKWNVVGIQGALLSRVMEPVYLHGISVGGCVLRMEDLKRGCLDRINVDVKALKDVGFKVNDGCRFELMECTFSRRKDSCRPEGTNISCNWHAMDKDWTANTIQHMQGVMGKKFKMVEFTTGTIGRKIGANAKLGETQSASRLSKWAKFQMFAAICEVSKTYVEEKKLATKYQNAKSIFLNDKHFQHWITSDTKYQSFSL